MSSIRMLQTIQLHIHSAATILGIASSHTTNNWSNTGCNIGEDKFFRIVRGNLVTLGANREGELHFATVPQYMRFQWTSRTQRKGCIAVYV